MQRLVKRVVYNKGTGIGGSLILDGNFFHRSSYSAGEWGNMIINNNIKFENIAATKILVENAKKVYPEINNGVDVF